MRSSSSFASARRLLPSSGSQDLFRSSMRGACIQCCIVQQRSLRAERTRHSQNSARYFGSSRSHLAESLRPQTFYEYFPESLSSGPPPQGPFSVDLKQLRNEFLRKQALAHPDRHTQSDQKARAEALSAQLNEAYKTLQDPLLRAQYLLSLRGINVAEDETAKVEDQQLLQTVMEAQEQIEEAEQETELSGLTEENSQRINESVKTLEQAFADEDIDRAKEEAIRLRYWTTIRDSIQNWEPGKPVVLIH